MSLPLAMFRRLTALGAVVALLCLGAGVCLCKHAAALEVEAPLGCHGGEQAAPEPALVSDCCGAGELSSQVLALELRLPQRTEPTVHRAAAYATPTSLDHSRLTTAELVVFPLNNSTAHAPPPAFASPLRI